MMAHRYYNDFINITVSVPRASFNSSDNNGNHQVVPEMHVGFEESGHYSDEGLVPSPTAGIDGFESESFYDDFFGCIKKTPEDAKRLEQNYRLSSTGELKKLKERSRTNKNALRKKSPWRLIIEEEELITSSPVLKKPQAASGLKKSQKDQQAFLEFLQRVGWKTGILPGYDYLLIRSRKKQPGNYF